MAEGELVVSRAGIVRQEAQDALRCGHTEAIDRLLVVADSEDGGAAFGEQREDTQVAGVQVLVLVDHEELVVKALEIGVRLERLPQEVGKLGEERVGIDTAVLFEDAEKPAAQLVGYVGARARFKRFPAGGHLGQQLALDVVLGDATADEVLEVWLDDLVELIVVGDAQGLREHRGAGVH